MDYIVTSPQGKKFKVTAPEGATQEQVVSYAQANFSQPSAAPKTYFQKVGDAASAFGSAVGTGLSAPGRVLEGAQAVGRHALSSVAGDVAGLYTSEFTQDAKKGEAVRAKVSDWGAPTSEVGQAAEHLVGEIARPAAQLMDTAPKLLDEHGHPIAAQYVRAATDLYGLKKTFSARDAATAATAVSSAPGVAAAVETLRAALHAVVHPDSAPYVAAALLAKHLGSDLKASKLRSAAAMAKNAVGKAKDKATGAMALSPATQDTK